MPLFTVIIPAFNRKEETAAAVRSVLAQTSTDYEIIVVDDGSTDGTPLLEEEFGGKIIYLRQENSGVSSARNRGIRRSSSPFLAFLDSDDLWLPEKLAAHVEFISLHRDIQIHQTNETWIRRGRRVNPMNRHRKRSGHIFLPSLELCLISPSAVCMDLSLFDRYGLFDESLPACEDYDLWLRITSREQVGLIERELVVKHGGHADQLSRKFWGMDRFRVYAIIKILQISRGDIREDYLAAARESALSRCSILLGGAERRGNAPLAESLRGIIGALDRGDYSSIDARSLLDTGSPG